MLTLNPLSRNFRDWLYAFALVGMLLRVSMPLWALPQMSADGFMLMCTSQGMQWQLGEKDDSISPQLPCAQCGVQVAVLQSFLFSPPPPPLVQAVQRPRFAEPLGLAPPFLVAPPNRAPPAIS
ncbi:hypothetical protein D3C76_616420 [compost metagenome]|uniref:DUF2946 domain-containing protein n=1 Tax=Pseudomonas jinjuensis TaxID=198616 RepID=A0A1H0F754_9PSED|nr:DUF2946 family protein [Pseudomonas jinjuensis]SDN90426.1 hypothetical protein SAMN05216193_10681 [Pseudomonas jinjuensis]